MTNKHKYKKLLSAKLAILVGLLLLIAGGSFYAFKHNTKSADNNIDSEVKSSGLDSNMAVQNVGDVEKVIEKWVENNPEAIVKSVMTMQQKAAEKQQKDAQASISSKKSALFKGKNDPVYEPSGYNISMVEFFDYNCGYCKKVQATIEALLKEDKKVRIIFKELPILGPSSVELAKVSIAVNIVSPKNYPSFHNAVMKGSPKTKEDAIAIASGLGIDAKKIEKVLESKKSEIEDQIKSNQELASSIGINGTPAFIIGETLVPGALDIASFKEKIAAQRKGK